jgi:uncharacterized linocin/CFP29 family protein
MENLQILFDGDAVEFITHSHRPVIENGIVVNSPLREEEWKRLDAAVIAAWKKRLVIVNDLKAAGLTDDVDLAVMVSQWSVSSKRPDVDINMDGRTAYFQDLTARKTYGVPVPILSTGYEIGARELMASRRLGAPIDVHEAQEAAFSLAEGEEKLVLNGNSSVMVDGYQIYGLTTHPQRDTATATAYGGGDFAVEHNATKTLAGMINALSAKNYYGPFAAYVAPTQYNDLAISWHTDGSGQTFLQRAESIRQLQYIRPCDHLADGNLILFQLDRRVIELILALAVDNRQWQSPDGSALHFKIMSAISLRVKQDYEGNLGVAHASGC